MKEVHNLTGRCWGCCWACCCCCCGCRGGLCWWVSVGRLPTASHRPGGTPPSEGGVPPPRWAEPNYPRVSNLPSDHWYYSNWIGRDYNSRPLRLPPALLVLLLQHLSSSLLLVKMAFTFAAFAYILALIIDAFLIFFAIFHVGHVSVPINEQSKCFLWMIMKFFNWITTNHKNSIQMQLPTSCDDSILKYKLFLKIWKSINCVLLESKSKWGQIGPELWKATCAVSIQRKLQIVRNIGDK